jgi:hypothetical protein
MITWGIPNHTDYSDVTGAIRKGQRLSDGQSDFYALLTFIDIVTCMRFPWLNNVSAVVTMA